MDLAPYLATVQELADVSARAIVPWFARRTLPVEFKADQSPVTVADRDAEEALRACVARRHPGHGVIGEEFGNDRPDAEFVWVFDPIDGTKAFATACPLFGTLIGLLHAGRPVLGAIHQPVLRQLIVGDNTTTRLNGEPVRCRTTADLREATLLTSDVHNPERCGFGPAHDALAREVRLYRTWGDCYGYLLLASGWADIVTDPVMNPWDILPLVPVVRGAGAVITDWRGGDAGRLGADSCVAAVPALHAAVLARLNGVPSST